MQALKFLGIGLAVIAVTVLGAAFGGYVWTAGVTPASVAAADLKRGGGFTPLEKEALSAACMTSPHGTPVRCTCLGNRAAGELSPFERRVMTASLAGDAESLVALSKGLIAVRATPDQLKEAELGDKSRRIRVLLTACGMP